MNKEELIKFIKENLSINIETENVHCGSYGESELYKDQYTIQLIFDDEVISEDIVY